MAAFKGIGRARASGRFLLRGPCGAKRGSPSQGSPLPGAAPQFVSRPYSGRIRIGGGGAFTNDPYGIFAPWRDGDAARPPAGRRAGPGNGRIPRESSRRHAPRRSRARVCPQLPASARRSRRRAGVYSRCGGSAPEEGREAGEPGGGRDAQRGLKRVEKGREIAAYLSVSALNLSDFVEIGKSASIVFATDGNPSGRPKKPRRGSRRGDPSPRPPHNSRTARGREARRDA